MKSMAIIFIFLLVSVHCYVLPQGYLKWGDDDKGEWKKQIECRKIHEERQIGLEIFVHNDHVSGKEG